MRPLAEFFYVECVCMAWFTFEFAARLLVTPRKWRFVRESLNLIDLCTIVPFYVELLLEYVFGIDANELRDVKGGFLHTC